jgi:HK97 family phage major capsid protein
MEIDFEKIQQEIKAKRVRYVWRMSDQVFKQIRRMKSPDGDGRYLWRPDLKQDTPGQLMGHDIWIVPEQCFELVVIVPEGATAFSEGDFGGKKGAAGGY